MFCRLFTFSFLKIFNQNSDLALLSTCLPGCLNYIGIFSALVLVRFALKRDTAKR